MGRVQCWEPVRDEPPSNRSVILMKPRFYTPRAPHPIEVRGPNVFDRYWRNPEKTQQEIRDSGFFITGDQGYYSWV